MGTDKTCSLRFFTWSRVESSGQKQVSPVCPIHPISGVHILSYGHGVAVTCPIENHVVNHCRFEEFRTEQEEARVLVQPEME